jgi:hypothetical protein
MSLQMSEHPTSARGPGKIPGPETDPEPGPSHQSTETEDSCAALSKHNHQKMEKSTAKNEVESEKSKV